MTVRSTCAACAAPIEQKDNGRPRKFCSDGCRRAADLEVRRADRQLAVAEAQLAGHRHWLAKIDAGLSSGGGTQTRKQAVFDVERAELRIAELHSRLRTLLNEGASLT